MVTPIVRVPCRWRQVPCVRRPFRLRFVQDNLIGNLMGLDFSRMSFSCNGQVDLSNKQKLFTHLQLESDDEEMRLSLTVFQGARAWSATLSPEFFKTNASRTQTQVKQYVDMTIEALGGCRHDMTTNKYISEIVNKSDDETLLVWKKKLPGDDMVFKLGTTVLQSIDASTAIDLMLTFDLTETARLRSLLTTSEATGARLVTERDDAITKYRQAVDAKEELEQDLLVKFVTILNAKKAKIRELTKAREAARELSATITTKEKNAAVTTKLTSQAKGKQVCAVKRPVKRAEPISFTDSDSEDGSDSRAKSNTPPKRDKLTKRVANDQLDDTDFDVEMEESPVFMPLRARVRPPKNKLDAVDPTVSSAAGSSASKLHQPPSRSESSTSKIHGAANRLKIVDPSLCDTVALMDDM